MNPIKVIVYGGERVVRDVEAKHMPEFSPETLRQPKARIPKCGSDKEETFFAVQRFKVLDQGRYGVLLGQLARRVFEEHAAQLFVLEQCGDRPAPSGGAGGLQLGEQLLGNVLMESAFRRLGFGFSELMAAFLAKPRLGGERCSALGTP